MDNNKINGIIWDILDGCDEMKSYEIGDGWVLQFYGNCSENIWDWGIALGKIDDEVFEGEVEFLFRDYGETLADIFEQGRHMVEEMANDIEEYIGQNS